nr:hypothetical protein [uncultured Mediterranean phage uvMED]
MSTYDSQKDLLVYKYLRKYLDKIIKEEKNNKLNANTNAIRREMIIEILNDLEGK